MTAAEGKPGSDGTDGDDGVEGPAGDDGGVRPDGAGDPDRPDLLAEAVDRMAHQIKNPLQAVAMNLEVIRMRVRKEAPELWSEIGRHGEAVDENVSVLDRRVRLLLSLGRRSPDAARESVDVARLIDDFAAALRLGEEPPALTVRSAGTQLAARARPGYVVALLLDLWITVRELAGEVPELPVVVETDGERVVVEARLPDLGAGDGAEEAAPRGRWERAARNAGGRLEVAGDGEAAVRLVLPAG